MRYNSIASLQSLRRILKLRDEECHFMKEKLCMTLKM